VQVRGHFADSVDRNDIHPAPHSHHRTRASSSAILNRKVVASAAGQACWGPVNTGRRVRPGMAEGRLRCDTDFEWKQA
jgi:hypothetical protein